MGNKASTTAASMVRGKDLSGKVFLITGAYSGLGAASTKALLSANATVIVAGRNEKLQKEFVEEELVKTNQFDATKIDGSNLLDLGDLESVKSFSTTVGAKYPKIDVLLLNAGVMATPPGTTKQGFETQMGVNGIGHFLLAKLLAKQTKRQVWVSSRGHAIVGNEVKFDKENAKRIDLDQIDKVDSDNYQEWARYQQSKLANVLLAKQFHQEYEGLESCSCHPGPVHTSLFRHMDWKVFMVYRTMAMLGLVNLQTPDEGASTQVMVCVADKVQQGGFYGNDEIDTEANCAKDYPEDAKELFDYCDKVTTNYQ